MQKKIRAFDFDGTITTKDTLIEFIEFVHGRKALLLGFLKYSPLLILMKLHLYPNYKAKEKIFTHFFAGMDLQNFNSYCEFFAYCNRKKLLRPAAIAEIEKAKREGDTVIIVSASIDNWVSPFFNSNNPNEDPILVAGTQIEVDNDEIITGRFKTKNCYGIEKVRRIEQLFPDRNTYHLTAYGDSNGDKEMLKYADEAHFKPFRD